MDEIGTETKSSHVAVASVELNEKQVNALAFVRVLGWSLAKEDVHLVVVMWGSFELPWRDAESLLTTEIS